MKTTKAKNWYRANNANLFVSGLFIIWAGLLPSCAKEAVAAPEPCTKVVIYSDKYTIDTVYLRTDVEYRDCLTGINLERNRAHPDSWHLECEDYPDGYKLKHFRVVIGNQVKPIYKKE